MAINVNDEDLLSLSGAAKKLPLFNGKHVHPSTLWRWCITGVRGIQLEHVRVGARICTSVDAMSRFTNRLAEAQAVKVQASNVVQASKAEKTQQDAVQASCAALESEGFTK